MQLKYELITIDLGALNKISNQLCLAEINFFPKMQSLKEYKNGTAQLPFTVIVKKSGTTQIVSPFTNLLTVILHLVMTVNC